MPYRSYWVTEPYIYGTDFQGTVTTEEIEAIMQDYLNTVAGRSCYFMLDMSSADSFPTDMWQIDSIANVVEHDNTRWFAVVNPDVFANFATRILVRDKAKIFENRAGALGFLRGMVQLDTGIVIED